MDSAVTELSPVIEAEPLWDLQRAAKYLNLEPEYIRKKAAGEEIPAKKIGKYWRFIPSQLVAWSKAS